MEKTYFAEMAALLTLLLIRTTTSSGMAIHDHTLMLFLCVSGYVTLKTKIAHSQSG